MDDARDDAVALELPQLLDQHLLRDAASRKFRYSVERLGVHVSADQTTVTGRVTGDFPGSPVELQYHFRLEGDKIARLKIAP